MKLAAASLAFVVLAASSSGQADSEQVRAALESLNARADRPFQLREQPRSGGARDLVGGMLRVRGERQAAALEFVNGSRTLLAIGDGVEPVAPTIKRSARRVKIHFTHAGLPIDGAYVTVSFGSRGRIAAAHSFAPPSAVELGELVVPEADASSVARQAIDALRLRHGRTDVKEWREPQLARVWTRHEDGLVPTWRVELATTFGDEVYRAWVDGRDGTVLRTAELTTHAEGIYPFFGQAVPFKAGSAKGAAFANVNDSLIRKSTSQSLKNWALGIGAPANFPKGLLTGAHVDVWDANDVNAFAPNGDFRFSIDTQADFWDQSNVYFQLESNYAHLRSMLGFDLGVNFSLPVIVNFKTNVPNAFFSPSTFPIDDHSVGFLVFHDLEPVADSDVDFARDPAAVDHEHTHAWIFFEDEAFLSNPNEPPRALGEALPDFYAAAKQNDFVIGRYLEAVIPGLDLARDLQGDAYFINTINDAIAITGDLPEEHEAGKIFGSLCTDLRMTLGTKTAEQLVYASLAGMPDTMAEVGFGSVDANNAVEASATFMGACAFALYDAAGFFSSSLRTKIQAAVLGASTARGVIGSVDSTVGIATNLANQSKGLLTIHSSFIEPDKSQTYFFTAPQGALLSVKLQGQTTGLPLHPDFVITDQNNDTNAAAHTQAHVFTADLRGVSEKGIQLLLPTGSIYKVILFSTNGLQGTYTLTLDV